MEPVWTPDGARITYRSNRDTKTFTNLYWQRADGAGETQRLTESRFMQFTGSWHPSGKYFAYYENSEGTNPDIWILPMDGNEESGWKPGKPTVFLHTPAIEQEPAFSPDGRWLAYHSNESGAFEVYVRPFPGPGGKWQISSGGGQYPTWSRARSELFFNNPNLQLMVAPYRRTASRSRPSGRRSGATCSSYYDADEASMSIPTAIVSP